MSTNERFRACVDGVRRLAGERRDERGRVVVRGEQWDSYKVGFCRFRRSISFTIITSSILLCCCFLPLLLSLLPPQVHVSSRNTFPTAAGLASSAAGYAALVRCLAEVFNARETYRGELSTIARRGSGSACRSLDGGFVAWRMGAEEDGSDSMAEQVCHEGHWPEMRAVILVISDDKKDTSSTSGMATSAKTSELLQFRVREGGLVERRMSEIESAYKNRDFSAFGKITMQDSNQFHSTCLDTYPPIFYMNDSSKSVIKLVHAYNEWKGRIAAAYTFDAGPNAVLYCLEEDMDEILALVLQFYPGESI